MTSLLAQRRLREHADPRAVQEALARPPAHVGCARPRRPARCEGTSASERSHCEEGLHLASAIDDLATSLQRNRPLTVEDKEEQLYEKLVKRTRSLASRPARTVFGVTTPDERVYYLERVGGIAAARSPA